MKLEDIQKLSNKQWANTPEDHRKMIALLEQMGIEPGNFYQEMEMSGRYVNTHRDISHYNAPVNLHSHDFYEILYCHKVADVEYLIGANRYRLQQGDIIFIPPGVSHRPILPDVLQQPYERYVIWLTQEFVDTVSTMFPDELIRHKDDILPVRTMGTRWESLGDLFLNGVLEEEGKRPGWDVAVIGNTMLILANMKRLFIERTAGTMKAEKPELLDGITAYIESNYARRITIDELAKRFYVSNSTISHLFKLKMGVSIYSYITQRRLIAAKERIAQDQPLEEVAEQVGFSDYSTFYRAFKQEFGISPKQYRQRQT